MSDRGSLEPEDVLRILRRVGLGLLVASLVVDLAATRLNRWRVGIGDLQYRVLHEVGNPGAMLADLAVELLDATSSKK